MLSKSEFRSGNSNHDWHQLSSLKTGWKLIAALKIQDIGVLKIVVNE